MSGSTLPTTQTPDESQAQDPTPAAAPMSSSSSSSLPMIALVVRLITLASLVVSISLLASNSANVMSYYDVPVTIHFNDIYTYRYVFATGVIGLAYTLIQLPFSIYQVMSSGKHLSSHAALMPCEFVGDKIVLSLVATGVGAIFGVTVDLKSNMDEVEDAVEEVYLITTFFPLRSKLDDFFNRTYIPAIFLLIAFVTCGVSSILSSLALTRTRTPTT